jgi:hypothetical protein
MKNIDQARIHFEKAAAIYRELHSTAYDAILEIEQFKICHLHHNDRNILSRNKQDYYFIFNI